MTIWFLSTALARSWCADPLVAHEWGVTILTADESSPLVPVIPEHFHRPGDPFAVATSPVRSLPPDSGVRTLPVVQFYAPTPHRVEVPLGVEVGFRDGAASVWYPSVDRLVPAALANSPEAAARRVDLVRLRDHRTPLRAQELPDPGPDHSRQLHWSNLVLTPECAGQPVPSEVAWVQAARAMDGALWVNQGAESERFLFYEANTVEKPAVTLSIEAGSWFVTNRTARPVHDIFVVKDGRRGYLAELAPDARMQLQEAPSDPRAQLVKRWTRPKKSPERNLGEGDCVMSRDPALPVEQAGDYRMYAAELDLMLSVWDERLFGNAPHLMYREDAATLDDAMPVSLYTDMHNHILWSRLGLVIVEGL